MLSQHRDQVRTIHHAQLKKGGDGAPKGKGGLSMRSLKFSVLDAFDHLRTDRFARPAAEKFGGAWLACFLVMARGNVFAAFSFEHALLASVCGIVSATVAVAVITQMDRTIDSAGRQATISAIATFWFCKLGIEDRIPDHSAAVI